MDILLDCFGCGKDFSVKVPFEGFLAYQEGALIQDAYPDLSATDRESLISQLCPCCQKKIFG